jgi:hypothetical protein
MSKHTPIIDRPHPIFLDGYQKVYRFPNGYGASVIQSSSSYGLELGVVKFTGDKWHLTYETPVTDDVLGDLTPEFLEQALDDIAALAKAEGEMK